MEYPWFKIKKYPHIGYPITVKDRVRVIKYVENKNNIGKHNFLPLLHKSIVQRKFRVDLENPKRNPKGKRRRVLGTYKIRDIYYASHLDSNVFSYYNFLLTKEYEKILSASAFNESVVAYRKIPIKEGSKSNKCNIDFAKTAFEFIHSNSDKELTVIVADVTGFFDNLDHKILKKTWRIVLGKTHLPKDHYNVFKALTNLRYVEEDQLFNEYKDRIIVEKGVSNHSTKKHRENQHVSSSLYLKEKNAVAFCEKDDFIKNNINLIITKKNTKGIPQGSPISATLANVYMLSFDETIFNELSRRGGFYQRYSDDLIIVCKRKDEDLIIKELRHQILNLVNLEIHPGKTKIYHFEERNGKFCGFEIDELTKTVNENKTLEYLGFQYNGEKVLIKTAGFSKFHRSMKRSFKKYTSLALNSKNPDKKLFKSKLYKRFTYKGAKRKLIYRPSTVNPKLYLKTKKQDWGNYISYIDKANESMHSINQSDSIKMQGRKLWNTFHKLLNFHQKRINKKFNHN